MAGATLAGCRSTAVADPATSFQEIHNDLRHGDLDVALQKAEKARENSSASSADWAMKFRLLEAEILTDKGRRPEVIALLNSPGVSYPAVGDLAIKRNLLCGLANARLGHAAEADTELQEAQRLSEASNSSLIGEVLRTEAVVQIYRDHLSEGADLSQKSLKVAREQRDSFLEASDLLNLGFVALRLEHYDEAVALLNEGADSARPIQARSLMQLALRNMGTAYFDLGDFEKALSSFQQAQQVAIQLGATSAQVDSLWGAGAAYYALGNLDAANRCYQEALKDALTIHSLYEIAGLHTNLASVLFQERQFDAARMHSEEAIRTVRISGDKEGSWSHCSCRLLSLRGSQMGTTQNECWWSCTVNRLSALLCEPRSRMPSQICMLARIEWRSGSVVSQIHPNIQGQRAAVKDEELRLPFFANGDASLP